MPKVTLKEIAREAGLSVSTVSLVLNNRPCRITEENRRRIKAIGTVSAVNIGSIFRNGWENNVKSIDALPYVEAGSNARTSDISSGEYAIMPLAPMKESDAPNEELRQAWEYYHTPRAQYPTAPGYATLRSLKLRYFAQP